MKAKQQRDFQSHLRKHGLASGGSSQFSQTGTHFHKISPLNDNLNATVSDGRINMSTFLENMQPDKNNLIDTKAPVKTLFDHGHTKRNKLVIYDDDPRIEAVMKQALDRHKDQVRDHEEYVKRADQTLKALTEDKIRSSDLRKREIKKENLVVQQALNQQIVHNVSPSSS